MSSDLRALAAEIATKLKQNHTIRPGNVELTESTIEVLVRRWLAAKPKQIAAEYMDRGGNAVQEGFVETCAREVLGVTEESAATHAADRSPDDPRCVAPFPGSR